MQILVSSAFAAALACFALGYLFGRGSREPRKESDACAEPETSLARAVAPPAAASPIADAPVLTEAIGLPERRPAPGSFGLQVGAFQSVEDAAAFVERRQHGFSGFTVYVLPTEVRGKGTWHRVRLGSFPSRERADEARQSLEEDLGKSAIVVLY